jgi:5'-3' exonuclease
MHYLKEKQVILDISEDDAMRFYYEQLLKGDPTDNIPGVPRVGEVKAKALISDCLTEEDMQERVVSKYVEAYGDDWYNHFLINAKLIHIQSHIDDYFDPRQWPIIQELTA